MRTLRHLAGHMEEYVAGTFMALLLLALSAQVASRYLLGSSIGWTEEVARYLFIWLVFLGASAAIRRRIHVAVDLFGLRTARDAARIGLALAVHLCSIFFFLNMAWWGALGVARMWDVPSATLQISTGLLYLIFPLAGGLMTLRTLVLMRGIIRGDTPPADENDATASDSEAQATQ